MTHNKRSAAARLLIALVSVAALVTCLGAVETLSQRRHRVEAMSADQLDELFRNEQQFRALSYEEQQRIRDLHDQIESDPDRDKLRATLRRYCKWFETQPLFRRAKLLDKKKTLDQRIATVKEFRAKPGPTKDLHHLDDRNRRVLAAWLDRYIAENRTRFIENIATSSHPEIAKLPPERQHVVLREMILRHWQKGLANGQMPTPIAEHEMARLRAALSSDLRSYLEAKKPGDQARIIADWLREAASHELDKQLADFFENKIDEQERDRLMSLPGEEMYLSLSKQYRDNVLKQSKSTEAPLRDDQTHRGDHPGWQRGHYPGPPRGSGVRRRPESRDDNDLPTGKEPRDKHDAAVLDSSTEKPQVEKRGADKPRQEKSTVERRPDKSDPKKSAVESEQVE